MERVEEEEQRVGKETMTWETRSEVTCAKQLRCARATLYNETPEHPDLSEVDRLAAMQQREGPRREGVNGCGTCNVWKHTR